MARTPQEIETLIGRVALKDRAAFSDLYDATSAKLFGICLRVLHNRAEAEDALQDVYARIWDRADRYAVTGHSPITWLATVARNLSIDRLRARAPRMQDVSDVPDLADQGPGPEAMAVAKSEAARLGACLQELDARHSDAVRSAYLDGTSYADLAARHDVPLNTMRTWLRRSLMKLKACLTR